MKFQKNTAGQYESGDWTIVRTHVWELRHEGVKVMGYTTLAAAKAGAEEYAQRFAIAAQAAAKSRAHVAKVVADSIRWQQDSPNVWARTDCDQRAHLPGGRILFVRHDAIGGNWYAYGNSPTITPTIGHPSREDAKAALVASL